MLIPLVILTVITFCALNVIFLEFLVKQDPGVGNLVTFSSFLFITIQGFIFTTKCGTVKPKVPIKSWAVMVVMYFVVSVVNNAALGFNISMPLHMIFRAGSLMANMVLGMIILKKRYTPMKYLSVVMISVGIAISTIASGQNMSDKKAGAGEEAAADSEEAAAAEFFYWLIGIGMLTFALFMSARMGIYQEVIYKEYGKHPQEALFYCHSLPLPFFLFMGSNIYEHFMFAVNSPPLFSIGPFPVPSMLFYLACNTATQFICISAVYRLTSECYSLTVTLVVTLRKFLSLLFSIWYFQNPFTLVHWAGTVLVFSGTLLFSDIPGMMRQRREAAAKDATKKAE